MTLSEPLRCSPVAYTYFLRTNKNKDTKILKVCYTIYQELLNKENAEKKLILKGEM